MIATHSINAEYAERVKNMNYIIAVNKNNKFPIILDYETNDKDCCPEVGYITEFEDWETQVKEYMNNDMECYFDGEKVLSESGIYKIEGYWEENDTPDGLFETYWVTKVTKIEELPY